jgi:multiple sugar transport system permease protein
VTTTTRRPNIAGWLLLAPMLAVLGFTSIYPFVYALVISLFDWNWGLTMSFVGLRNYTRLLADPEFWQVMRNTLVFAASATGIEMVLGLGLAVAVDKLKFGATIIRTLLLTPLMISGIIVALMSKVLLDSFLGIVNYLLEVIGIGPQTFYGTEAQAMFTVVMVDTWWQTAFVFIILLAGLQSLPKEPMEAARIDGASELQIFRHVTLPMLAPLLITVLVIRSIDTLKVFDIVFGTTGGGPGLATEVAQTLAYRTAFSYLQISRAMTVMVLFSILVLALCALYMRAPHSQDR